MHSKKTEIAPAFSAVMKVVLAAAFCAAGILPVMLDAQAPAAPPAVKTPAPAQKAGPPAAEKPAAVPAQKGPAGIQTLPVPSSRDSVKPDEVVLSIGPEKFTRERYERMKRGLPPQYAGAPMQMGDRMFANNYAVFRGLAMVAEREKLDQTPEFKEQMDFTRQELLARLAINHLSATSQVVTDEEAKKYYDAHAAEFQQAKLRAIFVALQPPARTATTPPGQAAATPKPRTDAEARNRAEELRKKILAGADFAEVARTESDHLESAPKGGDLGNIRRSQIPNFEKVVFNLKPKEVSEPVKESNGYFIFSVDEIKPVSLDEATASIRNTLQQEKFQAAMKNAQAQYPVVFNDKYFGEAPAAAAPGAAPAGGAGAQPARPVITGVAPAPPQQAPAPPPAAKKPQ